MEVKQGVMGTHASSVASWVPSHAPDRAFTKTSAERGGPGRCFWQTGLGGEAG